jgi:hypothetical protein
MRETALLSCGVAKVSFTFAPAASPLPRAGQSLDVTWRAFISRPLGSERYQVGGTEGNKNFYRKIT